MNYSTFNKIIYPYAPINLWILTLLKEWKVNITGIDFETLKTMGNTFLKLKKFKGTFSII